MNAKASRIVTIVLVLAVLTVGFAPVQGAPPAAGQTHVVRWGETLDTIAARYGTTVNAIVQANGLANPNYIYVGQVLSIPVAGTTPGTTPSGGTYTVQWGDSLSSIAYRYGISTQALMTANGLTNPNFIYAGQVLTIPGTSAPPPASPPPSAPAASSHYTVVWGDTLESIAYRFGTTVAAIMQANGLANSWYIYAGQLLVIPGGIALPPTYPAASYYTVKYGDTLNKIAIQYGTTVWALVQANNLPNASLIYPGQVLIIPGHVYPTPPPPPPYYPTPVAPWPGPTPPVVTTQWVGRVTNSDCTDQDTNSFQSILRISVIGKLNLPVKVTSDGWEVTGLTGTKPEYGQYAVEFAPFNQGTYTIIPEGLGTSFDVRLDGKCIAYVEFTQANVTSTTP